MLSVRAETSAQASLFEAEKQAKEAAEADAAIVKDAIVQQQKLLDMERQVARKVSKRQRGVGGAGRTGEVLII